MDPELTVDTNLAGPEQRRARRELPERTMSEEPVGVAVEEGPGPIAPEDALAQAHRTIAEKEQERASAAQQAAAARAEAQRFREQAATTAQARSQDHVTVVAAAVETAKADRERAMQAYKMAREAGDLDAELKAADELADARYRFSSAADQLQRLKNAPRPQQQQQAADNYTPGAVDWINRNPLFNTDPVFKSLAIGAHNAAVASGIAPDTPAYFKHLDDVIAASKYGQKGEEGNAVNNDPPRRQPAHSGAPPNRGGGGGSGGANTVQTELGPVTVNRRSNGSIGIQIPPNLREDFEEGAKIAGMSLADYAYEQVQISEERRRGGNGGLVDGREGATFR